MRPQSKEEKQNIKDFVIKHGFSANEWGILSDLLDQYAAAYSADHTDLADTIKDVNDSYAKAAKERGW